MPNYPFKYILVILGLSLSIQAWANPTPSQAETNPRPPLVQVVQTANRDFFHVSPDEQSVIASFLPTAQISRLTCSKKEFPHLLRKFLLSSKNEARFKAEFIQTWRKLQERLFPDMTHDEILLEVNKLKNFTPGFFSYSQLYVFTKLYHYLAFKRNPLRQSNPSLNEFYRLSQTAYPQESKNSDTLHELSQCSEGCYAGCCIGTGLGILCCPNPLAGSILGAVVGGLRNSPSLKHFLVNSCLAGATCVATIVYLPIALVSCTALHIYDCFCPLNRENIPGRFLDSDEARRDKDKIVLTQMFQNIRKVPIVDSILKPFISERSPTEDERVRINQDIEFLSSIPQMREVLAFAGSIDWAQQPIANEVRIDILSDDDQQADNDDSSNPDSPRLESQPLLQQR